MKDNVVIYCGPFDTYGGYNGGIYIVVNSFFNAFQQKYGATTRNKVIPFNTVAIKRKSNSLGSLNFSSIKNSFLIKKNLSTFIKKYSPDCIYYNTSAGLPLLKDLFILNCFRKRVKRIIIHIHFADYNKIVPKRFEKMTLRYLKRMDKIVFLSKKTRDEFVSYGINEEQTEVLYNFSPSFFTKEEICTKEKNKRILSLLFIGSIDKRKGILDLLCALKNVERPFELNVCGSFTDDNVKSIFEKEVANFKNGSIHYLGYLTGEDKKNILLKSHILVLPSYGEGLPLVILEGLSAGCTILTTNVGANPEIVTNDNGLLINPGDVDSITSFIQNVSFDELNKKTEFNYDYSRVFCLDNFLDKTIKIIFK